LAAVIFCYRKAVADGRRGCLGIHVPPTPTKVKEHVQGALHKVVLNRIGVDAVARVREDGVILNTSTFDFTYIVLKVVG
jgi:hypothetical protein